MYKAKSMACIGVGFSLMMSCLFGCGQNVPASSSVNTPSGDTSLIQELTRRDEPITLTYASWSDEEYVNWMIKGFEEKYDWIKVENIKMSQSSWESGLFNLASSRDLPDVFWTFSLHGAAANGWLLDITELYNKDAYTQSISDGLKQVGVYDGIRYGVAVHQMPDCVFVNKTLFEQCNLELPSYNWKVDDMINLAKQMSQPNQNIFGFNSTCYLDALYPTAKSGVGPKGFNAADGTFDFSAWAEGVNMKQALLKQRVICDMTPEALEKAYGSADFWPPESGKIGICTDWYWTTQYMKSEAFSSKGIEWLIYPMPTDTGKVITTVDVGGVSATTEYPEEAYALLKYMNFGQDGWMRKIDYYKSKGTKPTALPIANDSTVWNALNKELTPGEDYAALYNSLSESVPEEQMWLPGYNDWYNWTWEQDIWNRVNNGELKAEDIAPVMAKKLQECYTDGLQALKEMREEQSAG